MSTLPPEPQTRTSPEPLVKTSGAAEQGEEQEFGFDEYLDFELACLDEMTGGWLGQEVQDGNCIRR
jgi:hypothetical protein